MSAVLALGTYRIAAEHLAAAAERAAAAPDPWIDTAPNYTGGAAHRLLAPVLAAHPRLKVATKTGYLTPTTARDAAAAGLPLTHSARHSLHPALVRRQIEQARTELGRDRLDAVFVHNPEHLPPDQLPAALHQAFAVLEEHAAAGHLSGYGVATWNGFTDGRFTVASLDRIAHVAACTPDHHLRHIQLPVSLVEDTALAQALLGRGPITHAAQRGWHVHASAPLHGGVLARLDGGHELAELLRPGATIAEAALAATASCLGVERVLLSTARTRHWNQALAALAHPPLPPTVLQKVLRELAAP
ncbi:aldo/keto reductase [Streptomyces sp. bgisy126]|uniref:aldo/keto reductase n=1 Tax=unclassified Streptomyces TaxID=2593676 RepID=UPI003EBAFF7D